MPMILLATLPAVASVSVAIFGQVVPAMPVGGDAMLGILGQVVTPAVLAFYVIYDIRYRTPYMLATFASEQAAVRKAFADEQAASREMNRVLVEQMRASFIAEQAATRSTFVQEQAASRLQFNQDLTEMRQMVFESLKSHRQAVHDMRDTVTPLVNSQNIANAMAEKAAHERAQK